MALFCRSSLLVYLLSALHVLAYIPAQATNSTHDAIEGGLNVTDISKLYMMWYSNGSYNENVSYQLVGNGSNGISKGALVHFSEDIANNSTPPTTTPWIALVSCEQNATDASMEEDIFTLARDKGAVAALLYSLTSVACVINPEYADPNNFDQIFDIFSTQSLTSAHLIEYQFGQLSKTNSSIHGYDSQKLNNSAINVNKSIDLGYAVAPDFLYAILQAYNATGSINDGTTPGGGVGTTNATSSGSPNTALAMIILYAITGCVSALFCVVIISGAIRAIRHPERYGPRARMGGDGEGPPQGRARGLARAVIDTFPIVKFGTSNQNSTPRGAQHERDKDMESGGPIESPAVELKAWEMVHHDTSSSQGNEDARSTSRSAESSKATDAVPSGAAASSSPAVQESTTRRSRQNSSDSHNVNNSENLDRGEGSSALRPIPPTAVREDVVPAAIGRETCPICIVDFEEGDDLRILPCEGKHCFHQQCVDPWLLELSSSCPICRHDFFALENLISGEAGEEDTTDNRRSTHNSPGSPHTNHNRFSRYLRFAARRRNRRRGEENDPTDPYMPTAPETSMYHQSPSHNT
ncbi:hypothetical protein BDQ12DRAFT_673454 [Crucibulum laeve]|uniref:RING-type domain-containing protein n=1 Tax=Crucibulum laeve TaxID=68775 RepID=A0A5C3MHR8_9AGAR|nr:hypothetical protein BDQ12DRAFT_673454 [Crucibulum laeve]